MSEKTTKNPCEKMLEDLYECNRNFTKLDLIVAPQCKGLQIEYLKKCSEYEEKKKITRVGILATH